ncbi:hypothetical protein HDU67_004764, partial [Dinochytrium kinnereticum]
AFNHLATLQNWRQVTRERKRVELQNVMDEEEVVGGEESLCEVVGRMGRLSVGLDSPQPSTPTLAFFQRHGYTLSPDENVLKAFKRLAVSLKWREATRDRKRVEFHNEIASCALELESKLCHLQSLCRRYGLEVGSSVTQCTKTLRRIFVNIYDVVGGCDRVFVEFEAFRRFTRKNPFPKDVAKAKGLRVFLRQI